MRPRGGLTMTSATSTVYVATRAASSVRLTCRALVWCLSWMAAHRRWTGSLLAVTVVSWLFGSPTAWAWLGLAVGPTLMATAWAVAWPQSYERWAAGPSRRRAWRRWVRRSWPDLARACGLSRQGPVIVKAGRGRVERMVRTPPALVDVTTEGSVLTLRVAASPGQTLGELEDAAERLAVATGAHSFRAMSDGPSHVVIALTMADHLAGTVEAAGPDIDNCSDRLRLGRDQQGKPWDLQLAGRHTLVVGCSGSGKGSILWGVCGGLAHAVVGDHVRLWGIDLKRGVELGMGRSLFTTVAYTPTDALGVLRELLAVINARGDRMAGASRLHVPRAGDPTHVLVIDELAALTAYGEAATCREANRFLGEILTQGRALGVVVVACVQDPRKEVVGLRGLFTQTVALRLRSAAEVAMVLGESMSKAAPAHRISPSTPGTAWVVQDDGGCNQVRADYWPDSVIQATATSCHTLVVTQLATSVTAEERRTNRDDEAGFRKPRSPRKSRSGRATSGSSDGSGEAGDAE